MKKRITALMIAVSIALLPAGALARETNYFGDFKMPETDFSQIKYERYDIEKLNSVFEEIRIITKTQGNEDNLFLLLEKLDGEIGLAATMYQIAYLNESKDNSKENNEERETAFDITAEAEKEYRKLYTELSKTPYRPVLEEYFGGAAALEEFLGNNHTDRYYSLITDEQELISEYRENEFGTYVLVTDEGEEFTGEDFLRAAESAKEPGNADADRAEYETVWEYYTESNKILGDIYLRLVHLRNDIAKEEGYDNYIDYAYEKLYYRDYTPDEAREFGGYVKKYSNQTLSDANDILSAFEYPDINMTDDQMLEAVGENVNKISSEMGAAFEYMTDKNMYDMEYSDKKITPGSAYTTSLYSYGTPYLFMSPYKDGRNQWKLDALIHEFGHFNTMLYDPAFRFADTAQSAADIIEDRGISIDIAEINSQGLELLMTDYYGSVYRGDTKIHELSTVGDMLSTAVSACEVSNFELSVYSDTDMTLEELTERNNVGFIEHLFTSPLYYISYATSAMAALDIWMDMKDEGFDKAADKYLKLCAMGDYQPFKESIKSCGFDDIFTEEYSKRICDMINSQFGLKYEDMVPVNWFYKPVFEMLEYISPNSETYFGAETDAVRAVVADSIAKMCGSDFDSFKSGFSDVAAEDDKYIGWAKANGIVEGYSDTVFGADDRVTREQAVAMLYRLAKHLGYDVPQNSVLEYTDSLKISSWAYDAVAWADNEGIIDGFEDGSFRPGDNVLKCQLAQMLYRFRETIIHY